VIIKSSHEGLGLGPPDAYELAERNRTARAVIADADQLLADPDIRAIFERAGISGELTEDEDKRIQAASHIIRDYVPVNPDTWDRNWLDHLSALKNVRREKSFVVQALARRIAARHFKSTSDANVHQYVFDRVFAIGKNHVERSYGDRKIDARIPFAEYQMMLKDFMSSKDFADYMAAWKLYRYDPSIETSQDDQAYEFTSPFRMKARRYLHKYGYVQELQIEDVAHSLYRRGMSPDNEGVLREILLESGQFKPGYLSANIIG
jgi:hypothetical protein